MEPIEHDELTCDDEDCTVCADIHDVDDVEAERLAAHGDELYAHWKDEGRHDR